MKSGTFLLHPENADFVASEGASIRRPKLSKGLGSGCLLAFLVPFVLAGLGMAAVALWEINAQLELARFGVETTGSVVDRRVSDSDDSTARYISYTFTTDRVFNREQQVGEATYDRLRVGSPVTVRYSSRDASVSRIDSGNHVSIFIVLAVVWNVAVGALFKFFARHFRRQRRLAREGTLLSGRVVRCSGSEDSEGAFRVSLDYAFENPRGLEVQGKHGPEMYPRDRALPSAGEPIALLYLDEGLHALL